MQLRLGYGSEGRLLDVPSARLAWFLGRAPGPARAHTEPSASLHADPYARAVGELAPALAAVLPGRRVGLLVPDATRPWDPALLLGPLLPLLGEAAGATLLIATGTHDAGTPESRELVARLRALVGPDVAVAANDARSGAFRHLGRTSRGTPVEIDERLLACDVLVILSEARPHYFAGYSNPLKYVAPGMASVETARANHAWALEPDAAVGRHPWHPAPGRRTNPVAEDMLEVFELAVGERTALALTYVQEPEGITWARGGPVAEATRCAFPVVDERLSREVEPVDVLVVSCGGRPFDESLYTAQRALELSAEAVRDGGHVLFLAECANGIGPPGARENFFEPLCAERLPEDLGRRSSYRLYGHKPVRFARHRDRLAGLHLASRLPSSEVRAAGLVPAPDPAATLARLLELPGAPRVGVLDGAAVTWVRAAPFAGC